MVAAVWLTSVLVTFAGSVGLTLNTSLGDAIKTLQAPAVLDAAGGSSLTAYLPICRAGVAGTALFSGPDEGLEPSIRSPSGRVIAILFTTGARTDHGVGIGSTKAAVKHAYAQTYKDPRTPFDLFAIGPATLTNHNPNVHPIMLFKFDKESRVIELVLTIRDELKNSPLVTLPKTTKTYCP
jgi:hypothetical protein